MRLCGWHFDVADIEQYMTRWALIRFSSFGYYIVTKRNQAFGDLFEVAAYSIQLGRHRKILRIRATFIGCSSPLPPLGAGYRLGMRRTWLAQLISSWPKAIKRRYWKRLLG